MRSTRRLANAIGWRAVKLAAPLTGVEWICLDYPTSAENRPRYGHGSRAHPLLEAVLARHEDTYRSQLETFRAFAPDLLRIPLHEADPLEPCWINPFFCGLDGVALYCLVRHTRPSRYVEVGSGYSTRFAARARRDGALGMRITSIDPSPRREIDRLADEVVRRPFETVELAWFEQLEPGDIVLFDGSHRVFMGSDVVAFFLDVVPSLPAGVLVGIDDIHLPEDYPPEWSERYYSEQYMLAAYLLAGTTWMEPLLASRYVSLRPPLDSVLDQLWGDERMRGADRSGLTFWFRVLQH